MPGRASVCSKQCAVAWGNHAKAVTGARGICECTRIGQLIASPETERSPDITYDMQARLTGYVGFLAVSCWVTRENLFALMITSSCSTIVRLHPPKLHDSICSAQDPTSHLLYDMHFWLQPPVCTCLCALKSTPSSSVSASDTKCRQQQDQLSALVGHSGTVSPSAVITVICCLLVVNAVFYLGFMHLVYHILLRWAAPHLQSRPAWQSAADSDPDVKRDFVQLHMLPSPEGHALLATNNACVV